MSDADGAATAAAEMVRHAGAGTVAQAISVMSDDEIRRSFRMAKAFAEVGSLKGAPTPEVAFAKMMVGRDLGIGPAQSVMSIDFVEGGVMIRGVRLLAWLREHATYDYRITETSQEAATVQILAFPVEEPFEGAVRHLGRWWEVLGSERFTVEDAQRAGKIVESAKAAWNAYRKNMLIWRATSNAVKFHAPDVFNGIPVYTEADFDVDGSAVEVMGDGDRGSASAGATQGLDLGPRVEAILSRAAKLGHAGIADRATAEMTLREQSPGWVDQWCANATRVLDEMESREPADAVVVEPGDEPDADDRLHAKMLADAEVLADQADVAEAEGRVDEAEDLRGQAVTLRDEIDARWPDAGDDDQTQIPL
jgi:hypothetical protein